MERAVKPYNEAINRRRRGMDFGTGNHSDARRKHWKRVSGRDRTNAAHARHAGSADALRGDDGDFVVCAGFPGGGYCCQGAMFAVLLRQGFCVPAGFAGVMLGFAAQYAAGALAGCWQLPSARCFG